MTSSPYYDARIDSFPNWLCDNEEELVARLHALGFTPQEMSPDELLEFAREEHQEEIVHAEAA